MTCHQNNNSLNLKLSVYMSVLTVKVSVISLSLTTETERHQAKTCHDWKNELNEHTSLEVRINRPLRFLISFFFFNYENYSLLAKLPRNFYNGPTLFICWGVSAKRSFNVTGTLYVILRCLSEVFRAYLGQSSLSDEIVHKIFISGSTIQ